MNYDMVQLHVDPHVHCRDWKQSYKATIKSVTELARSQGVKAIFDMPNTDPPIISKELVEKRIKTAEEEECLDDYYLYIGITKYPEQIKEAVEVVKTNPKVVGIKMFAGKSVGDLTIPDESDQARVYEELSQLNYDGVLAVHCEKESLFRMNLWNPNNPQSWNFARPIESEIESVKDQIRFAKRAGFKGTLHICHISTPEAVEIIQKAKNDLHITCGVTPHHLSYSTLNMKGRKGLMYKVNPPLRDNSKVKTLRDYLKQGKIDWIETDHAPHTRQEKLYPLTGEYMSGIQSLRFYSLFLNDLRKEGFTENQIYELTYGNIKRVFRKIVQ